MRWEWCQNWVTVWGVEGTQGLFVLQNDGIREEKEKESGQ